MLFIKNIFFIVIVYWLVLKGYKLEKNRMDLFIYVQSLSFRKIDTFLDCPFTKLIKQDIAAFIRIDLLEHFRWITNLNPPFLKNRNSKFELFISYSSIFTCINRIESNPILIVLSKIKQEIFELSLRDIIIPI